jgi:hypothetical protein
VDLADVLLQECLRKSIGGESREWATNRNACRREGLVETNYRVVHSQLFISCVCLVIAFMHVAVKTCYRGVVYSETLP